jgi:hypothetical protein
MTPRADFKVAALRTALGFALALLAALGLLLPAERPGPAADQGDLVVLATASNRGEVDPCG